jgi:hypothetical protein
MEEEQVNEDADGGYKKSRFATGPYFVDPASRMP